MEECVWGGGSHGALLFDTTLSYHIPAFLGSMVPILYDLYIETFFQRFSWAVLLGFNPQETES